MPKYLFIIIAYTMLSFLVSQDEHAHHNHGHNHEIGMAIGIVPGHKGEENNLGLHLHCPAPTNWTSLRVSIVS